MSESNEALEEIRRNVKGKILLVGRKIGQEKFDDLGAGLRIEAKPLKYLTVGNLVAWSTGLFSKFAGGEFESIVLHRFLYKRVKEYIEDPVTVLAEVERILPTGGVLIVNSFLLDDVTKDFRSADSFFTEEEMKGMLENQGFRRISRIATRDTRIFICEK